MQRRKSSFNANRLTLFERSNARTCEPCKKRKIPCDGRRPCNTCEKKRDCFYSVVPDQARGVFSTSSARRLSSGSACEVCRRRKTKCDGGTPCGYCAANNLDCVNNSERRKRSLANIHANGPSAMADNTITLNFNQPMQSSPLASDATLSKGKRRNSTNLSYRKTSVSKKNHLDQVNSPPPLSSSYPTSPPASTALPSFSTPPPPSSLSPSPATPPPPRKSQPPPRYVDPFWATSSANISTNSNNINDPTMDRIQDRLLRIEQLMNAFTPTAIGQKEGQASGKSVFRKLSTPQQLPPSFPTTPRPHRHSVQGISVAKEQAELRQALASKQDLPAFQQPLSPPTSKSRTPSTQLTSSMLNLTLSPSSSTSSNTSQARLSASPVNSVTEKSYREEGLNRSPSPENDWKPSMPSLMEQLSRRTFTSTAMEYQVQYPIYPLTPPSSISPAQRDPST
ncbi:hypothetical protein DM01DRAFT_1336631 [Hesseltinella vesiculosa]|uniref:Zn(2)-C6 fungal-type domain-containing protein n=1 Tax=Hesseltinella vesiculosa TaxID=101127 RepID=A0A1X2GFZ9_9FUNG|nr:hypothetical protein DM01DRAFT_1336631 [Hesseltinella vesiculosa]